MKMLHRSGVAVFFLWAVFLLQAGGLMAATGGKAAAAFLNLGVGARALAMGEAYSTQCRGAEALYWNPAGLAGREGGSLLFSYNPIVENTSLSQAAVSFPWGKVNWAAGYSGVMYDAIDAYDDVGNNLGEYDAADQLGILGFGMGNPFFKFGLSAKYIHSTIDDISGAAFAGDVGVWFANPLIRPLSHSLVAANIGSKMTYLEEKEDLPAKFVFGTGLAVGRRVKLAFDYSFIRGQGGHFSSGMEWLPFSTPSRSLALRGGYTTRRNKIEKLSGAGLGAGFGFGRLTFDYAWIPYGELGDSHSITAYLRFSTEANAAAKRRKAPLSKGSASPVHSPNADGEGSFRSGDRALVILMNGETIEGDVVEDKKDRLLIRAQGRKVQIFKKDILKSRLISGVERQQQQ